MRHCLGFVLISLMLLTGCSYNPFVNYNQPKGENVVGAGIGAGAAGGLAAWLRAPAPMVGAAAVGGGAVGYYLTTIRYAAGPIIKAGGDVYSQGDYLGISIPSYKLFEPNTADFLPQAEPIMDSVVSVLNRYPNSNISITTTTSGFGLHSTERMLSIARSRRVASYLWAHGINNFKSESITTRKLSFTGYGSRYPVADEGTLSGIQANSRVQITVYPSQKDLRLDKRSMVFNNVGDSNPRTDP